MIDLAEYVRPGDTVVWGQACAEPLTLTEQLMAQRESIGQFRCFLGIQLAGTAKPLHADHVRFVSYCGTGGNRPLAKSGVLDIYPGNYSSLPWLVSKGPLRADVVLVQCSPPDGFGRYSLGLAADYLVAAIDAARVVIAEINDRVPFVSSSRYLTDADIDVCVHASREPATLASPTGDAVMSQIAQHAAGLIEDGATLQFGIGALPELVLSKLHDRRHLGVHSGLLSDSVADLVECGAMTNGRKVADRGVSIGAMLIGTRRLFDATDGMELRSASYTHDPAVLAAQPKFVAINSAIEVDLTGQVNAEVASGTYVGAVGGGAEFLRAAARSDGGVPMVVLPSAARGQSRIVRQLSGPVSTARADAGVFVTEFGVADLRGQPLAERRRRMIAIAHPDHQEELSRGVQ